MLHGYSSARKPEPPGEQRGILIKATRRADSAKPANPPYLVSQKIIMVTEEQLRTSSEAFFDAFAETAPSIKMLHYFSTTTPTIVQHTPAECPHPLTSRVCGSHGIRSYFDLLSTHWTRSGAFVRDGLEVDVHRRRVVLPASILWTWRKSGRSWREDFTWTLDFDEHSKISSFIIRTMSSPGTCVMRAIDCDPVSAPKEQKACAQTSL